MWTTRARPILAFPSPAAMRAALLLSVLAVSTAAQPADTVATGWIVGVVTDAETGDPLIGASVWLVDTAIGAATDIHGRFAFRAPAGEHLVRTAYIGYEIRDRRVSVEPRGTTTIRPALKATLLCECVITFAEPEAISHGIYQARVVSYWHWESSCCSAWMERSAVPVSRWVAK